jgi:hypothetical protein
MRAKLPDLLFAVLATMASAAAAAGPFDPIVGAFGETKPIVDTRLRFESVDQVPFTKTAQALTLRGRLGFETGKAWSTALLVEGEAMIPLDSGYNSTTNGKGIYPVVADPESYELNRLQLTNIAIPSTTITLGRQRIVLDDHRFVGNVAWRQNEQTFDALRFVNKSIDKLTIDVSYINQVNRVFGPDGRVAPNFGRLHGDSYLANLSYQLPIGKLTGFGYLLSFSEKPQPLRDSTQTYGFRLAGDRPLAKIKLSYALSAATQSGFRNNPLSFSNRYYLAELTGTFRRYSLGIGEELMQGNGVKGFTTPLATLHKFDGWADKFLTTPANGLEDRYVTLGFLTKGLGPLDTLSASAVYHKYRSDLASIDYGSEVDLQLQGKWRRFSGMLKYAKYDAVVSAQNATRDTKKLWAEVSYAW